MGAGVGGPGRQGLVMRLLDQPQALELVRALPARALAQLVAQVGLEDAGQLVALASVEQLQSVLDGDVWKSAGPGKAEAFDPERFGVWLEVMLEMGANAAAQRLLDMDPDFVAHAFQSLVMVLDLDALALAMSSHGDDDDGQLEKQLDAVAWVEVDRFRLMARAAEGFDAFSQVVTSMDEQDHGALMRLLERLAAATHVQVEEDGLHHVLSLAQEIQSDAEAAREERRDREGYVAPQQAAAFLALARTHPVGQDPITRAALALLPQRRPGNPQAPLSVPGVAGNAMSVGGKHAALRAHLQAAADRERQVQELTYLANVVVAGAPLDGAAMRDVDAVTFVMDTCNLALEMGAHAHGLVALFGLGMQRLLALGQDALDAAERVLRRGHIRWPRLDGAKRNNRPWDARLHTAPVTTEEWPRLVALTEPCPRWDGAFLSRAAQLAEARAFLRTCGS